MRRNVVFLSLGLFAVLVFVVACGGTNEVIREVEVEKVVTQEVVKEVVKEVPVIKEVVKEVEVEVVKTVVATPTAAAMMSKTGTIPGSKLLIAFDTVGNLTKEPRSDVALFWCRPGCVPIKDQFMTVSNEWAMGPYVVKSWDFDLDGDTKTWTLDMQEGIEYWDGRPATIDDLMWSIFEGLFLMDTGPISGEKLEGRPLRWSDSTPFIDAISRKVVDDDTLEIKFPGPTLGLAETSMTTRNDSGGLRDSKTVIEKGWKHYLENFNGSGPYIPTKEVAEEVKEFEVFVDWWKGAPDFEIMHMLEVPEGATRLAMLGAKQVDIAALSAVTMPQASKMDHVKILVHPNQIMTQWFFTNIFEPGDPGYDENWPFLDKRVREAFNLAIDRDLIIDRIYQGTAARVDTPLLAPGMIGWDEPEVQAMKNNPIPYDPGRARQLLEEANFPMDMKLRVIQGAAVVSGVPELTDLNTAILTQLRQNLDLDVELIHAEVINVFGAHRNNKEKADAEFYGGERHPPRPDGAWPEDFYKTNGWNWYLPGRKVLQPLYEGGIKSTTDISVASRNSAQISKIVRDEWMYIPMTLNPILFGALSDKVESWVQQPASHANSFWNIKAVR